MKKITAVWVWLGLCACLTAQGQGVAANGAWTGKPEGILRSVENARVEPGVNGDSRMEKADARAPMKLVFSQCEAVGVERSEGQWWVMPIGATDAHSGTRIEVNSALWVLPLDATSIEHAWRIVVSGGEVVAEKTDAGLTVLISAGNAEVSLAEARPHSDPFGYRFEIRMDGGKQLGNGLAAFYWGTMLPSVVEKTMAARFPYSSGYVLSTLNVRSYAGSYPAVDHEFQIKGRLAMSSEADLDVVRRMIDLQIKLMEDDPERLYRAPTSVQPDGRREYHVRRSSEDHRVNAAMFPLTGNIEVMEEAWRYYEATKDRAWLQARIASLEHAAGWTRAHVDEYGRVWSDVYYEDQVMKDGRVTQAQAFAANSFGLLGEMERCLGRLAKADEYEAVSTKLAHALIEPLPMGFWDGKNQRFVDWVDRDGNVHDHLHLLANELPVMLGYATKEQAAAVRRLIEANDGDFERFPSFLSADVAGYTKSEIGDGGPYDLSAAGRYWYWDAAYRASEKQNDVLFRQLMAVAAEGAKSGYFMGERYDMDHVYYVDGKDAHGAEKYYEYPNVYSAVLITQWLGLTIPSDADLAVAPHTSGFGAVEFTMPRYAVAYSYDKNGFVVRNLADRARRFKVDLSALEGGTERFRMEDGSVGQTFTVVVPAHGASAFEVVKVR